MSARLSQAATLARVLMNKHDLGDWVFEWDRGLRRAGCCNYTRKKISLSRFYVEKNPDIEVIDTIKHEIAHARAYLDYGERGHGDIWKQVCITIGAKPQRCYSNSVVMPEGRWSAQCPNCKKVYRKHRLRIKPNQYHFCPRCGPKLGVLTWVVTG